MNCPMCGQRGLSEDTRNAFWANLRGNFCGCFRCGYIASVKQFLWQYDGSVLMGDTKEPIRKLDEIKKSLSLVNQNGGIPQIAIPGWEDCRLYSKYPMWSSRIEKYLLDRGWTSGEIRERGAGFSFEKRFFGRAILPFYWFNNELTYFQARALKDGIEPKYLNPAISKDYALYNIRSAVKYDEVILVEGIFDCVLENCVAILGKTLTAFQLKTIAENWKRVIIFFGQ